MKLENKDMEELSVCLAIQKVGLASPEEIKEKLDSWDIDITQKKIERFCKNLQKKGITSHNYIKKDGINVVAYSLAKAIFQRDIPIAHYKDIVDLKDSKIAKDFIKEKEKKKETNKGRKPDHCKYYTVNVTFEVVDKVLGFMPFNTEDTNEHYRDVENNVILLPSHFRAWFGHNLRLVDKSNTMKNYIAYSVGEVELSGKMGKEQFPVLDGRQGRGIKIYESIPKGSKIKTKFGVPETDFTMEKFRAFLDLICESPLRGFGGRSMTGYGHMKVIEFKAMHSNAKQYMRMAIN